MTACSRTTSIVLLLVAVSVLVAVSGAVGCTDPREPADAGSQSANSNRTDDGKATTIPDLPHQRQYHTAALLNGRIYLTGGSIEHNHDPTDNAMVYAAATGQWRDIAPMGTARLFHALAVHDGLLYAAGGIGIDDYYLASLEVYDPATDAWTALPDMPTPRHRLAAAFVDGKLIVIGGLSETAGDAIVEQYDPATREWSRLPDLIGGRHGHCAVAFNDGSGDGDRAFVIGGVGEGGMDKPTLEWDPGANQWQRRADIPAPQLFFGAGVIDDAIYIIGGRADPRLARYDPTADVWTLYEVTTEEEVNRFGCVALDGHLVVLAGEKPHGGPTAKVQVITPPTD